jgi:Leucine-rich repeat (LRR) protein
MNKIFLLIGYLCLLNNPTAQNLVFKDTNFLAAVVSHEPEIDLNGDGYIQKNEADSVRSLQLMEKGIDSMEDAYHFPNLEKLVLTNNEIMEVRLVGFSKMREFYCAVNKLIKVEVRDMPVLQDLALNYNKNLDSLSLKNIPSLVSLSAEGGRLGSVDVSIFPLLRYLSLSDNKLSAINISKNSEIVQVRISGNPLTELDIRFNPKMETHILYLDKTVRIIATESQLRAIEKKGSGMTIHEK